jgi:hypothetical protein
MYEVDKENVKQHLFFWDKAEIQTWKFQILKTEEDFQKFFSDVSCDIYNFIYNNEEYWIKFNSDMYVLDLKTGLITLKNSSDMYLYLKENTDLINWYTYNQDDNEEKVDIIELDDKQLKCFKDDTLLEDFISCIHEWKIYTNFIYEWKKFWIKTKGNIYYLSELDNVEEFKSKTQLLDYLKDNYSFKSKLIEKYYPDWTTTWSLYLSKLIDDISKIYSDAWIYSQFEVELRDFLFNYLIDEHEDK